MIETCRNNAEILEDNERMAQLEAEQEAAAKSAHEEREKKTGLDKPSVSSLLTIFATKICWDQNFAWFVQSDN